MRGNCAAIWPAFRLCRWRSRSRMARRVGSAMAAKASSRAGTLTERLELRHAPAALEPPVVLGGIWPEPLEAMVEQLDQGPRCHRRQAQGDQGRGGPAVPEPVLLEGQLSRRVVYRHPPGEPQRLALHGARIGLDQPAGARFVGNQGVTGPEPEPHPLEGLELLPHAFGLGVDPDAPPHGERPDLSPHRCSLISDSIWLHVTRW